jgi:hypothetical protein
MDAGTKKALIIAGVVTLVVVPAVVTIIIFSKGKKMVENQIKESDKRNKEFFKGTSWGK